MPYSKAARDAAASVVHDLGNLIQIASSAINILARNSRIVDSDLEPVISGAKVSLSRASALVRQRMGAMRAVGRANCRSDLVECLAEIEALVAVSWDARFRVRAAVADGLPKIKCDPTALQSAMLNLMLNARDAMPDGSDIALRAVARPERKEVEILVADTGIGMSEQTMRRAFDPFFTTKADGLGGVGLPSVERFARETGGRVRIDSRLGIGTLVALDLPAAADDVA